MKQSVISLSLLLLVIHFSYGLLAPRTAQQHPTRLAYKNKDGSTLTIFNSDVVKPTLKEIIYYHLIEKPYPQEQEQDVTMNENSEETTDSGEATEIDPRKDEPDKNSSSTQSPDQGRREKREVSLEKPDTEKKIKRKHKRNRPEKRLKREYYRDWVPYSPDLTGMSIEHLPDYAREILGGRNPTLPTQVFPNDKDIDNLDKAVMKTIEREEAQDNKSSADREDDNNLLNKLKNPKYAYIVGRLSSRLAEKANEINCDDESTSESSSDESGIWDDKPGYINGPNEVEYSEYEASEETVEDNDVSSDKEKESKEDNRPGVTSGVVIETTTFRNNNDSKEPVKPTGTSDDDLGNKSSSEEDNDSEEDSGSFEHEDGCEHGGHCNESGTISNFNDILNEIHQIFVEQNSTIELKPGTIFNPENFNILNVIHTILNEHNKSNTHGIIIKPNPNQPNFLDVLRGLFTNIIKNNIIINNNVPITPKPINIIAEKDRPDDKHKPTESIDKPISDRNTTTEKPEGNVTPKIDKSDEKVGNNSNINQGIVEHSTILPLHSTTVKDHEKMNKNKTRDTDKQIQVSTTTTPATTESSTKRIENSTTPTPIQSNNNTTTEKIDGAEVHKEIDYMLDLVNNEKFWKFMGDIGGKYLESLMTHTSSTIKEEVKAQVKEHLDALKKIDEKSVSNKEKDKVKENKAENGHSGEKNRESKNINETVSIKTHNLYGNTVGNDKVTNVYVFYAKDNIDDIIKDIHEIANKTQPINSTNIFTYMPNLLVLNNDTIKHTTAILSGITIDRPKTIVNHDFTVKPNHEQKPTEPTETEKHPSEANNNTQTNSNCKFNQSHCKPNEGSHNPNNKPYNITVHTTENILTTFNKEQTPEITTSAFELIPEKLPVTETTHKPTKFTDKVSSKEPVTENIGTTTESITTKRTTIAQTTSTDIQTTSTEHSTGHTETTTDNNHTIKPGSTEGTTTASKTTVHTTDISKSSTEYSETTTSTTLTTKGTTAADKPANSSTEGNHDFNNTSVNTTSSDINETKVTTESMKPVTDSISSTTESASTTKSTTSYSTITSTSSTQSDSNDNSTTKPSTKADEGTNHISTESSLTTESNSDVNKENKTNSTESVTDNIKTTTETISTKGTTILDDQTASKNETGVNNGNTNSTTDRGEIKTTTESSENKTDKVTVTVEATTETTAATKPSNDENKVTTEESESSKKDVKETTESSTEKHEEMKA